MSVAPAEIIDGAAHRLLLLCDHASAHVPHDIDLGIDPELLDLHIAIDIGAADVTRALAARLDAPAILGTISRLVIDLHREPDHPGLIPHASDGHEIPGNSEIESEDRVTRFHMPYHATIEQWVAARRPDYILSIHSFTAKLEQGGSDRPWEIGILYNEDARLAGPAIEWLRGRGLIVGDNEPYSGRALNATLNRHAEANDIPSFAVEIRNDLIRDAAGVDRWTDILAEMAEYLREGLDR